MAILDILCNFLCNLLLHMSITGFRAMYCYYFTRICILEFLEFLQIKNKTKIMKKRKSWFYNYRKHGSIFFTHFQKKRWSWPVNMWAVQNIKNWRFPGLRLFCLSVSEIPCEKANEAKAKTNRVNIIWFKRIIIKFLYL